MRCFLSLSILLCLFSGASEAAIRTPAELCQRLRDWRSPLTDRCFREADKITHFDSKALEICASISVIDFKPIPACLRAIANKAYSSELSECKTLFWIDFRATVKCLFRNGTRVSGGCAETLIPDDLNW